jgi:hypothetical protein
MEVRPVSKEVPLGGAPGVPADPRPLRRSKPGCQIPLLRPGLLRNGGAPVPGRDGALLGRPWQVVFYGGGTCAVSMETAIGGMFPDPDYLRHGRPAGAGRPDPGDTKGSEAPPAGRPDPALADAGDRKG